MEQNGVYRADGSCLNLGGQNIMGEMPTLATRFHRSLFEFCSPYDTKPLLNFQCLVDTMLEMDILSQMYKLPILKCYIKQVLSNSCWMHALNYFYFEALFLK
jgi:hypothetical protein